MQSVLSWLSSLSWLTIAKSDNKKPRVCARFRKNLEWLAPRDSRCLEISRIILGNLLWIWIIYVDAGELSCLGEGFISYRLFYHLWFGPVAQWLEQGTHNPLVVGSSPTGPTKDN